MALKLQTIKRPSDFNAVFKGHETKVITSNITVLALRSDTCNQLNIGYIAGKKSGGAVLRNFIKRRARAIMRNCMFYEILKKKLRIILIPRHSFHKENFNNLVREMQYILQKVNNFYN